jgi:hypothetical protein
LLRNTPARSAFAGLRRDRRQRSQEGALRDDGKSVLLIKADRGCPTRSSLSCNEAHRPVPLPVALPSAAPGTGALRRFPKRFGQPYSFTSIGLLITSRGDRLNSTLTVTVLPTSSLGTRHECEQTPPQPNSMSPDSTGLPSAVAIAKVGLDGSFIFPLASLRLKLEYCSPPAP